VFKVAAPLLVVLILALTAPSASADILHDCQKVVMSVPDVGKPGIWICPPT
jgi:hypothetical protein